jgi:arylsulfatase A-like enzyme
MSHELAQRVSFGRALVVKTPFAAEEQQDIIAAYDNALAYADEQIGRLLQAIEESTDRNNTYIILTSDHGEAFGEHDSYGHGWTLYREELHVPLMIVGPGVPAGLRIPRVARLCEIFPTVMELTLGQRDAFTRTSLRRHWDPAFQPEAYDLGVVSELKSGFEILARRPSISLTTQDWHYLHHSDGRRELYRWTEDPGEQTDLSGRAEFQPVLGDLHTQLCDLVRDSAQPWYAPPYLLALNEPGLSYMSSLASGMQRADRGPPGPRVGMAQDVFPKDAAETSRKRVRSKEDLLRSLPYR